MPNGLEGIGQLLANNPVQIQQPAVEMEQPKLEENKSLWRSFVDKAQNDPNMRTALLSMGANLLRSPQFGQNGWDVTANAIASGVGTYAQGRTQQQQQQLAEREQTRKESDTTASNATSAQNAATYGTAVQQQGEASRASAANASANTAIAQQTANLEAEIAPRRVAAQETAANAAMTTAKANQTKADKGTSGSVGQNERLVNQRKAALMALNPGLSDEEATLQAQNELLKSRQGGNPATIAKGIFDSNVAMFQNNLDNLGKSPTPEQIKAWREDAIGFTKQLQKLGTGTETTGTSGVIDRSGGADLTQNTPQGGVVPDAGVPSEPESVVGRKVQGTQGIGEITGQNGDKISLRLPNGKEVTTTLEAISAYIIAE